MTAILHILTFAIFLYFLVSTAYLLVFALAGKLVRKPVVLKSSRIRNALILIPAYREDEIIIHTTRDACALKFEGGSSRVLVIADQLKADTIEALKSTGANVLPVSFEISGKARSLHAAISSIQASDDFVFILDADNVIGSGCFDAVNDFLDAGYQALQVHRTAKNSDTPIALLDSISEEINLNIFRRGAFNLGLSAAPMGSGMAFTTGLFKEIFSIPETIESQNEDRQAENYLSAKGIRLGFIDDAYIFDEKVANTRVLKKQRIRWMEAQLNQLRYFMRQLLAGQRGSRQHYHSFFQALLLPRVFYLALTGLISVVIFGEWVFQVMILYPVSDWWIGLMMVYWGVLIVSIPGRFYTFRTLKALFSLPFVILTMVMALFQLKKRRKEFLHTSKSFIHKD